ncbi:allantoinase [Pseudonocardia sp. N23]|nr:allantoinase [Pseudonocardia sp. N23]
MRRRRAGPHGGRGPTRSAGDLRCSEGVHTVARAALRDSRDHDGVPEDRRGRRLADRAARLLHVAAAALRGDGVSIASYLAHETGLPKIDLLHLSSAESVDAALRMAGAFPHIDVRREVTIGHLLADVDTAAGPPRRRRARPRAARAAARDRRGRPRREHHGPAAPGFPGPDRRAPEAGAGDQRRIHAVPRRARPRPLGGRDAGLGRFGHRDRPADRADARRGGRRSAHDVLARTGR